MNDQYASGEGEQPMQEDAEQSGYTICINVDGQGAMSVGLEGGEYTPVQSIDEAMQLAGAIYENDGQAPEMMSENDSLMKGYQAGAKRPMGGMSPAKVFGDE